MERVLVTWIGFNDLKAANNESPNDIGPISRALEAREFDRIVLLDGYQDQEKRQQANAYFSWLSGRYHARIIKEDCPLSPIDYQAIFLAVSGILDGLTKDGEPERSLTFHLSPGTPAMTAVWVLLGKTKYPAELIQTSPFEEGILQAEIPFDISMDFIPELLKGSDSRIARQSQGLSPETPEFRDIKFKSGAMALLLKQAQRVAVRSVPVLIEGESGTGKELLARAIHQSSPRREKQLIAINCGAIPEQLVESAIFGHTRGAYTGANEERKGCFEEAHGSTLFLDEIGELPLSAQVKLLRVLQEGEVTRIGSHKPIPVDVRVIAATNRHLQQEVAEGRFREDLFYRLAVAVFQIPALRERREDLGLLIDTFLAEINAVGVKEEPGYEAKTLSAGARNRLQRHTWPGNVRELYNTLLRAAIWSVEKEIGKPDIESALLLHSKAEEKILGRPVGPGFELESVLGEVALHYIERALEEAGQNKSLAASLVGFKSYQRLDNWLARYKEPVL